MDREREENDQTCQVWETMIVTDTCSSLPPFPPRFKYSRAPSLFSYSRYTGCDILLRLNHPRHHQQQRNGWDSFISDHKTIPCQWTCVPTSSVPMIGIGRQRIQGHPTLNIQTLTKITSTINSVDHQSMSKHERMKEHPKDWMGHPLDFPPLPFKWKIETRGGSSLSVGDTKTRNAVIFEARRRLNERVSGWSFVTLCDSISTKKNMQERPTKLRCRMRANQWRDWSTRRYILYGWIFCCHAKCYPWFEMKGVHLLC